jgi:lysophospholipase L1-like esterase
MPTNHTPAAVLFLAACAAAAPYHTNLSPALAPFEQEPRALFVGDSLTLRDGSFFAPLRASIQSRLGNAGSGWQSFSLWTGCGFDPGWIRGIINEDTPPHRSLDGLWAETSTTAWARIDPEAGTKTMRLVVNGSGTFNVWNTATNQTTPHTAPAVVTVTFPASSGRVWIQPDGNGPLVVLGAQCDNGQTGATLQRAANGGWGVSNFMQRDATFEQAVGVVDPRLIWIMLGQNDTPDYAPGEYVGAMRALIQRVRAAAPGAGVVVCSSYDSGSPDIARLADEAYTAAIAEGVGYVNLWAAGGPYSHFVSSGYLDDGIHHNAAGGSYVAGIIDAAIRTHGASLRWCAGDANQDGACNGADLSLMLSNFGAPTMPYTDGDLNGDGKCNGADLSVLLNGFGCTR